MRTAEIFASGRSFRLPHQTARVAKTREPAGARGLVVQIVAGQRVAADAVSLVLRNPPPLPLAIRHVLGVRTEKKVRGVHARRIVALVADIEAGGDGAVVQFPREPVREDVPLLSIPDASVSVFDGVTGPRPAGVGVPVVLVNVVPESFRKGPKGLDHDAALPRSLSGVARGADAFRGYADGPFAARADSNGTRSPRHAGLQNESDPGARRDPQRRPPVRGGRWQRDTRGRVDGMMYRRDQPRAPLGTGSNLAHGGRGSQKRDSLSAPDADC